MLIAITGLHKSGKSYFSNLIPEKYGFSVVNKKKIVEELCFEKTRRLDWNKWHAEEFQKNPFNITNKILERIPDGNVILDSVHSNLEWEIIKQLYPDAVLVLFVAMEEDRRKRWYLSDSMDGQNNKRIGFWHNDLAKNQCLLTDVSWCFNGSDSLENMEQSFVRLIEILKQKELNNDKEPILIKRKEGIRI